MAFIFPLNAGKYSERQYFTASSTALVEPGLSFMDEVGVTWKYVQASTALTIPATTTTTTSSAYTYQEWAFLSVVPAILFDNTTTGTVASSVVTITHQAPTEFVFPYTQVTSVSATAGTYLAVGIILNPNAHATTGDKLQPAYTVPANNFIMMAVQPHLKVVTASEE